MSQSRSDETSAGPIRSLGLSILRWFDSKAGVKSHRKSGIDWIGVVPFIGVHLMCFGVIWVGWSPVALVVAFLMYFIRMFALTGFYHRYFSHRTYKTNRFWQFMFALLGTTAVQKGPIWWAAHHRNHHKYSDTELDSHSPVVGGFWWSQIGWVVDSRSLETDVDAVKDLTKFKELRILDRFHVVVPVIVAVGLYFFGKWLGSAHPELGTSGAQMLIWGFFISTTVLFHSVSTINSLSHMWGWRRYNTSDESRNNPLLAITTMGEGWHNNHHHYQSSCRQGFYWWEVDITWYMLKGLQAIGVIRDMKTVPKRVRDKRDAGPTALAEPATDS